MGACFWCTIPIQKRTKYFFQRYRASALLVVEIHHDAVIEQIDGVDETVDDLLLKSDIRRVAVAELIEPEQNLLPRDGWLFDLLLQNAGFQGFTLLFQFLHPRLGGGRQDALLDGRHQIVNPALDLFQFSLQNRQPGVFLALVFQQLVRQQVDDPVIQHLFQRRLHHKLLQRFLAHRLQAASFLAAAFAGAAFIITVDRARVASAALSCHHGAALAAEQLGGEQIMDIRLVVGRCLTVNLAPTLHRVKTIRADDGRDCVRDDGILIAVFAQIPAIFKQRLETVLGERVAPTVTDTAGVQRFDDAADALPRRVPLERFLHHRCGGRVDLIVMLAVDTVPQRHRAAVELGLECIFLVTTADLLGQLRRIILGHAFQQAFQHDAFRCVGDGLGHRHHMDPVVFEDALIMG